MKTEQVKDKGKAGKTIKFILISGAPYTGKSSVCRELHAMICQDQSYTKLGGRNINKPHFVDFIAHYKKNGKLIVLNSASDDNNCMKRLAKYIDDLAAAPETKDMLPDVIITSIRETGAPISRMLALLEAIEKGTKQLAQHYTQNIANATPTTLIRNVAVLLHLTKQPTSGNKANTAIALAPYFKNIANDAKQELDRIV